MDGASARHFAAVLLVHFAHHGFNHGRQIFQMIAQRRHDYVEYVEPVVEVGAQVTLGDGALRIAIHRGQHAHVRIHLIARAQAPKLSLLQNAQQLGLRAGRHFQLISSSSSAPPAASSKQPALRSIAPVKGAFLRARRFRFRSMSQESPRSL